MWKVDSEFVGELRKFDALEKAVKEYYGNGLSYILGVNNQEELDKAIGGRWVTFEDGKTKIWKDED